MKELDGNFVGSEKRNGEIVLRFHNPSVRDFMQNSGFADWELIALTVKSIVFFEQLEWCWARAEPGQKKGSWLAESVVDDAELRRIVRTAWGADPASHTWTRWSNAPGWYKKAIGSKARHLVIVLQIGTQRPRVIDSALRGAIMTDMIAYLQSATTAVEELLKAVQVLDQANGFAESEIEELWGIVAEQVMARELTFEDFTDVSVILDSGGDRFDAGDRALLSGRFRECLESEVEWATDEDDPDLVRGAAAAIGSLCSKFGVPAEAIEQSLNERASELEVEVLKAQASAVFYGDDERLPEPANDAALKSMFELL